MSPTPESSPPVELGDMLRAAIGGFGVGIAAGIICYLATGPTLGLFFAGVALATVLVPALILTARRTWPQWLVAAGVVDGVAVTWLAAVFTSSVWWSQWLGAYAVLAAYVAALAGLTLALHRIGLSSLAAAAVAVVLGVAWLAWPISLAPWLTGAVGRRLTAALVPAHPLLSLNGLLDLGNWSEQSIAYGLMRLNQDIPYTLPRTIWPCVLVHALVAAGGLFCLFCCPGQASPRP